MIRRVDTGEEIRFARYFEGGRLTTEARVVSRCTFLHSGISVRHILRGKAHCSNLDKPDAEVGRRLALTRALAPLPRGERRRYWALYFSRSPRFTAEWRRCMGGVLEQVAEGGWTR